MIDKLAGSEAQGEQPRFFGTPHSAAAAADGSLSSRSKTDGNSTVLRREFQALEEKVGRQLQQLDSQATRMLSMVLEPLERRVSSLEAQRTNLEWRLSEVDALAQGIHREVDALAKHCEDDEAAMLEWRTGFEEDFRDRVDDAMRGLKEQLHAVVHEETSRSSFRSDGCSTQRIADLEERLLSIRQESVSRVSDLESDLSECNSKLRKEIAALAEDLRTQNALTFNAVEQNRRELKLVDEKATRSTTSLVPGELGRLNDEVATLKYKVAATERALARAEGTPRKSKAVFSDTSGSCGRSPDVQDFDDDRGHDSPLLSLRQSPRSFGRPLSATEVERLAKASAAQVQKWAGTELDKVKSMLVAHDDMLGDLSHKAALQMAPSSLEKTPRGSALKSDMSERAEIVLTDDVRRLRINVDGLSCNVRDLEARLSAMSGKVTEEVAAAVKRLHEEFGDVSGGASLDAMDDLRDAATAIRQELSAALGRPCLHRLMTDVVRAEFQRHGDDSAGKQATALIGIDPPCVEESSLEKPVRSRSFGRPRASSLTVRRSVESDPAARSTRPASARGSSESALGQPSDSVSEPEAVARDCEGQLFPRGSECLQNELRSELVGVWRMLAEMRKAAAPAPEAPDVTDALPSLDTERERAELPPPSTVGERETAKLPPTAAPTGELDLDDIAFTGICQLPSTATNTPEEPVVALRCDDERPRLAENPAMCAGLAGALKAVDADEDARGVTAVCGAVEDTACLENVAVTYSDALSSGATRYASEIRADRETMEPRLLAVEFADDSASFAGCLSSVEELRDEEPSISARKALTSVAQSTGDAASRPKILDAAVAHAGAFLCAPHVAPLPCSPNFGGASADVGAPADSAVDGAEGANAEDQAAPRPDTDSESSSDDDVEVACVEITMEDGAADAAAGRAAAPCVIEPSTIGGASFVDPAQKALPKLEIGAPALTRASSDEVTDRQAAPGSPALPAASDVEVGAASLPFNVAECVPFPKGASLLYNSPSLGQWIDCKVVGMDEATGAVRVDVKPVYWFKKEEQLVKFRPRMLMVGQPLQYTSSDGARTAARIALVRDVDGAVQLDIMPDRWFRLEEQVRSMMVVPFHIGDMIVTMEDLETDSQEPVLLRRGHVGRLITYDEEGDALIDFDGLPISHWIAERQFDQLLLLRAAEEAYAFANEHPQVATAPEEGRKNLSIQGAEKSLSIREVRDIFIAVGRPRGDVVVVEQSPTASPIGSLSTGEQRTPRSRRSTSFSDGYRPGEGDDTITLTSRAALEQRCVDPPGRDIVVTATVLRDFSPSSSSTATLRQGCVGIVRALSAAAVMVVEIDGQSHPIPEAEWVNLSFHAASPREETKTSEATDGAGNGKASQKMVVGCQVLVRNSMQTDSEKPVHIDAGTKGKVLKIDGDGDVLCKFHGLRSKHWIFKESINNLMVVHEKPPCVVQPVSPLPSCLKKEPFIQQTSGSGSSENLAETVVTPRRMLTQDPAGYIKYSPAASFPSSSPCPGKADDAREEASPRPQAFTVGENVYYNRAHIGRWVPCTIVGVRADGYVELSVERESWLSVKAQSQKLRREGEPLFTGRQLIQHMRELAGDWYDVQVTEVRADGAIKISTQPGRWIEMKEQLETLRLKVLSVGLRVEIISDLLSDSDMPRRIAAGTRGSIFEIDDDGDVLVKFDDHEDVEWIYKANQGCLRVVEANQGCFRVDEAGREGVGVEAVETDDTIEACVEAAPTLSFHLEDDATAEDDDFDADDALAKILAKGKSGAVVSNDEGIEVEFDDGEQPDRVREIEPDFADFTDLMMERKTSGSSGSSSPTPTSRTSPR